MASLKNYRYWGKTPSGRYTSGTLLAASQKIALQQLENQQIVPEFLESVALPFWKRQFSLKSHHISPPMRLRFTKQLALLLRAGISLSTALETLAQQETGNALAIAIDKMIRGVSDGQFLHETLANQGNLFDAAYIQMVRAGEMAGDLPNVLEKIGRFDERSLRAKRKTLSSLIYPLIVSLMALGVILFLCIYIVPRFQILLDGDRKGMPLPRLTRMVMGFSDLLRFHKTFIISILLLIILFFWRLNHFPRWRRYFSRISLRLPLFGPLIFRQNLAIYLRTLSILLENQLPFGQALQVASQTIRHQLLRTAFEEIAQRVLTGETLSRAFAFLPTQLPLVKGLIAIGEMSGQLALLLSSASDAIEEELDQSLERLGVVLQPLIVLFLAGGVAIIAVAMFLPLIQMLQFSPL